MHILIKNGLVIDPASNECQVRDLFIVGDRIQPQPPQLPEGTQTGTVFTLREKGIPYVNNPRRRGDQRFTVVVETPTKLSKEQKELLRQLEGALEETPKRKKFIDTLKDFFD